MVEQEALTQQAPAQEAVPKPEYDLHIKVPEEMRTMLKNAAELAYEMGIIPKPDLVDLMNLFVSWGMTVLRNEWMDRSGYRLEPKAIALWEPRVRG